MKQKLIFLDIDGTLLPPGEMTVPASAVEAIRQARANGHKVFLCTGRNLRMTKPLLAYGFDGFVCSAGGYVGCDGKILVDLPMEPAQVEGLREVLGRAGAECTLEARDDTYGGIRMIERFAHLFPRKPGQLKALGEPAFRAKQIYRWMHRGVRDFSEMTDISRSLRERLTAEYTLVSPTVARRLQSQKDGTIKYLWRLMDGNCVESVLMRYHYGNTICISSEVGCRMGCAFCASTRGGLVRRLEPSEMLDQVLFSQLDSGLPISHIVLMGIGEPLDNYDNVRRFLELVNSPEGLNIGMRHISLSTCGLVDQIDRLAGEDLQLTLSVSLHAPVDEVRSSIMPVNRRWPVQELLDACRRYFEKTGRRISFEYAMIRDVNDTPEMAKQLIRRLRGIAAHVNLIPLNDVAESPLKPSLPETVLRFQKTLEASGIPATVRRTLGSDINASCGQLRRNYEAEKPKEGSGMDGSMGTDGHGKRA